VTWEERPVKAPKGEFFIGRGMARALLASMNREIQIKKKSAKAIETTVIVE
jgi:hypothetical protein